MFGSIWLNLVIGLAMNGATSGLCQAMYHRYKSVQEEQELEQEQEPATASPVRSKPGNGDTTDTSSSLADICSFSCRSAATKDDRTSENRELSAATKEVEDRLVVTMTFLCITLSFGSAHHRTCFVV